MSYILDALQRAEAERGRGQVPGAHPHLETVTTASPGTPMGLNAPSVPSPANWFQWHTGGAVAGGLLLLAAVGGAVVVWRGQGAHPPTAQPVAPMTAVMSAASAPPKLAVQAPAPVAVPAPKPVPTGAARATPVEVAQPKPEPPVSAPPAKPAKPAKAVESPAQPPAVEKTPPRTTPTTQRAKPPLDELPETLRRELPSLRVTGVVYTADPSQRLLMLNHQVLSQGATAAPGLVLEEIEPHSAVFSFKGTRFRVAH